MTGEVSAPCPCSALALLCICSRTMPTLSVNPKLPLLVSKDCLVHRCLLLKRCARIAGLPWTSLPSTLGSMHTPIAGGCQRQRHACMRPRSTARREVPLPQHCCTSRTDMLLLGCG